MILEKNNFFKKYVYFQNNKSNTAIYLHVWIRIRIRNTGPDPQSS